MIPFYQQSVIIRTTIRMMDVRPRVSLMEDEPLVFAKGKIDMRQRATSTAKPVRFRVQVQVYEDGTFDILDFNTVKMVSGSGTDEVLEVYELAFSDALIDTDLKLLGVRRA